MPLWIPGIGLEKKKEKKNGIHYFPSLIIGSGISGLTASIYLSERSIPCLIFEGKRPGGALHAIKFSAELAWMFEETGKQIISSVREQAIHRGAQIFSTVVVDVDVMQYRPLFRIKTRDMHPVYHTNLFSRKR